MLMCVRVSLVIVSALAIITTESGICRPIESFELRYYLADSSANGETDFKGETELFSTEQRVEFLRHYGEYASRYFDDPTLDKKVVTGKEIQEALASIKPDPLPDVRQRIPLESWKYLGYKDGLHEKSLRSLDRWTNLKGAGLKDGALTISGEAGDLVWEIAPMSWRFKFGWRARLDSLGHRVEFEFSNQGLVRAATVGFGSNGKFFYRTAENQEIEAGKFAAGEWCDFLVEFDLATGRGDTTACYNFYVNGELLADYVPVERTLFRTIPYKSTYVSLGSVDRMTVRCKSGTFTLDDLNGVNYQYTNNVQYPYTIHTFIDQDFETVANPENWLSPEYDDSAWNLGELPLVHGGEQATGEALYLRREVYVGNFKRAFLNVETLDPGGEIWINGQSMVVKKDRHPVRIDITSALRPEARNLIAIRVDPFFLTPATGELMPHSALDFNVGWFCGRASLDLCGETTLEDVFVYTDKLNPGLAELKLRLSVNHAGALSFAGRARVEVYPWLPDEANIPVVKDEFEVIVGSGNKDLIRSVNLPDPMLWTPDTPNLYKIRVILVNNSGEEVDDYVLTTGVRILSQEGGYFSLNGKPAMLNGAQIMGFRAPMENLVRWNRCPPEEWVMKELLMVKRMNGNLLRIHVHAWQHAGANINDPRYAEYADQLGMMLIWGTPAWIRTGWGWGQIDFQGYPKYMRQVYNHPSIAMWEIANHTQPLRSNPTEVRESDLFCEKAYETIYPVDPSRLISFNSSIGHLHYANDEGTRGHRGEKIEPPPAWTAHQVTRGNQDAPTGYGKDWSVLRKWPGQYIQDFLDSKNRAYFNFEHEESIGQPNWNLVRGKPWYRLQSYEWGYDEGSVGRKLTADEWLESQAWQAFSAWEAMKKQRWLDYDGFSWCCLHGGANSVTYKKPLIDFLDHPKLCWYVNRMVLQPMVAGSADVDVVYGPDDSIRPVLLNLGPARTVDLSVVVSDINGVEVGRKSYPSIQIKAGRTSLKLPPFKPDFPEEGHYVIKYLLD